MWDVFISHASEDKEEIARPLAEALRQAGLRIWYDEFIIKPGDKINQLIRQGQNESTYALIILSSNFFKNTRWAQHELDGFVTREIYLDKKIIPVWHHVTIEEVVRFAPDLANRKALQTNAAFAEIVQTIVSLFADVTQAEGRPAEQPVKTISPSIENQQREQTEQQRRDLAQELKHEAQDEAPQPEPPQPAQKEPKKMPAARKPPTPVPPKASVIQLRSEPLTVSENEFKKVFGLNKDWRPLEYIQNDYEDQGEVVLDRATGLMWQKSGSPVPMSYTETKKYLKELNQKKFAGYDDWRLPTIPELLSLLEPEKQSNGLYINSMFDKKQWWCWSADLRKKDEGSAESAWHVGFNLGLVYWSSVTDGNDVRVVRP